MAMFLKAVGKRSKIDILEYGLLKNQNGQVSTVVCRNNEPFGADSARNIIEQFVFSLINHPVVNSTLN